VLPDVGQTLIFAGMAFAATVSTILLTGMFPAAGRLQNMQKTTGSALPAYLCSVVCGDGLDSFVGAVAVPGYFRRIGISCRPDGLSGAS
jgi:hypothetical protein